MKTWFSTLKLNRFEKTLLFTSAGGCLLVWIIFLVLAFGDFGSPPAVQAMTTRFAGNVPETSLTPGSADDPHPTGVLSGDATATSWPPTPTPEMTSTPQPTPNPIGVAPLPLDPDMQVIALLGIDEKQSAGVWRTDSLILVFVQPERKKIAMISIPRDLWVYIPGHGYNRINTVDSLGVRTKHTGGGRGLLNDTLRYNLGVPVHKYARIDFRGFVDIIDALGGVDVYVEKPIADTFPDPLSPDGVFDLDLDVGWHTMDGHTALGYSRSRRTTSDFDRSHRQQLVLKALWKKVLTPETIARAPKLWETFEASFSTDINLVDALALATTFQGLDSDGIKSVNLGFDTAHPWTMPDGAQVLLADVEAIQQIILDLLK